MPFGSAGGAHAQSNTKVPAVNEYANMLFTSGKHQNTQIIGAYLCSFAISGCSLQRAHKKMAAQGTLKMPRVRGLLPGEALKANEAICLTANTVQVHCYVAIWVEAYAAYPQRSVFTAQRFATSKKINCLLQCPGNYRVKTSKSGIEVGSLSCLFWLPGN